MIGETISHYKITEKLGEGGMGVVYKAEDTQLGRPVAIKFLFSGDAPDDLSQQRFEQEAQSAAALSHANICHIYDYDKQEGRPFLVMEYLEGGTLRRKLEDGPLSIQQSLNYARQIAEALSAAHEQGIVHRDIKPANIMISSDEQVKVMDFGLAKLEDAAGLTQTGSTVGTMAYMSPEQIKGESVDRRSDLFSLGVVFYEMLTGSTPFRGEHQAAMTYAIVNEEPAQISRYLPEAPEELTQFFEKLLAKDPEDRPVDASEVITLLDNVREAEYLPAVESPANASSSTSSTEESNDGSSITLTLPSLGGGKTTVGGARLLIGAAALVGLLLLGGWWFLADKSFIDKEKATSEKVQNRAKPTVAVLPFEVSGLGAEEWKDGMVTVLSLNLDGAAGLRAIPDRTIFAKWKQKGGSDDIGAKEALDIARDVGARYAIVGSAVQLGQGLRFGVEIREVASGERLGQVEVRGPPDGITALTNKLTRQILGVLLERSEGAIPSVNLESITTESLPALKAFLQGERHFRLGEYQAAIDNYEAAIEMDNTFAMAYARLNPARYWGKRGDAEKASKRAYEESDQLPRRERRIARARYMWYNQDRDMAAVDSLRQLSNEYPDDPSVWFLLGEVLWHGSIPGGWPQAEQAFQEAVQLDPGFTQYHHHLVDLAISFHHDSTMAAQRIAAHPKGDHKQMYQLALNLVFGSTGQRRKALGRLDSIAPSTIPELTLTLWHPTDGKLEDTVLRRIMGREDITKNMYGNRLIMNNFMRGQVKLALKDIEKQDIDSISVAYFLSLSMTLGTEIPDSITHKYLAPESLSSKPSGNRLYFTGFYLIEEGQYKEVDQLINRIRSTVDTTGNQGPSSGHLEATLEELKGYRAWKSGDLKEAEKLLSRSNESFAPGAIWRGDLYRELGKKEQAEGWYLAAWFNPVSHERLGQLYEQMDKPEKAAAAYRRFIAAWEDADPELQDRVEEARRRLQQLNISERGATEEVIDVEQ